MIKRAWRAYFKGGNGAYGLRRPVVLAVCLSFLLIKVFTWGAGYYFAVNDTRGFNVGSYLKDFHHLRPDARLFDEKAVNFFRLWNYADGEWYLSIAEDGYPSIDEMRNSFKMAGYGYLSTEKDSYMRYAFFPLFPCIVYLVSTILPLEAAAFTANLLINILLVVALLKLFRLYFPEENESALWPFLLLSLFPFSIFYSLYFPEALFLLLSICVFIFLKSGRYFAMALSGFLLSLTRPNGIFIALPVLVSLFLSRETRHALTANEKCLPFLCALSMPLGFAAHMFFCYLRTGNWNFYAVALRSGWGTDFSMIGEHIAVKLSFVTNFFSLPLHSFHASKADTLVMLFFGAVLVLMWLSSKFPWELTLWSTVIWVVPIFSTNDLMSFSRYMSVSFPIFLFLGLRTGLARYPVLLLFAVGYFFALRTIIRYEWLG